MNRIWPGDRSENNESKANSAGQTHDVTDLEKAVKLAPWDGRYRVHLAHALQQKGKVGKAIPHFDLEE